MNIIYMLLAISVTVAIIFFFAFIISVKKGQYDDTYTPSVRMLFDDETLKNTSVLKNKASSKKSTISEEQFN